MIIYLEEKWRKVSIFGHLNQIINVKYLKKWQTSGLHKPNLGKQHFQNLEKGLVKQFPSKR